MAPPAVRHIVRGALLWAAIGPLASCAPMPPQSLHFDKPVVLLGEVHDNAAQHALRLRAFEDWLAAGARPALLMEQFDRDRQAEIDRLRAQTPAPTAEALVAAAGGRGWDWHFYRPYVALALRYDLPLVAVNVSREEARDIMRKGLAASGFDARVPAALLDQIATEIEQSHCGTLDHETAQRLALAQIARDQAMARAVQAHAARGVLLLAGNGHVRRDNGVPHWLMPATRAISESIGLLEDDEPDEGRFDRVLHTPAQAREDPCTQMRR